MRKRVGLEVLNQARVPKVEPLLHVRIAGDILQSKEHEIGINYQDGSGEIGWGPSHAHQTVSTNQKLLSPPLLTNRRDNHEEPQRNSMSR